MNNVFAKLLLDDNQISTAVKGFEEAISISFKTNPVNHLTQGEIERRFAICADIFQNLRGDLKWSVAKCADALPTYLKCELDGVPYSPEKIGDSWTREGIEAVHDVAKDPDEKYLIK